MEIVEKYKGQNVYCVIAILESEGSLKNPMFLSAYA